MPTFVSSRETQTAQTLPTNVRSRRRIHPLFWILLSGLIVRLGLWVFWKDIPVHIVDARHYDELANSILQKGGYLDSAGRPTSLRPPLYPALVAGLYAIFGPQNLAAVRLVQALLSLITATCVYFLGKESFGRQIGLWAAAWCAFYPSFLGFNNLLLSETLFTLSVTAVTLLTVLAVRRQRLALLPVTGVVLGLGALTRSVLWLFAPLLGLYLLAVWKGSFVRRFVSAAAMFCCFVLVIAPWVYRNTRVQQTLTIIDCMGGRNAMMGNYEHTPLERSWATIDIVREERAWYRVLAAKHPDFHEMTQGQRDKLAMRHGIQFVLTHPLLTLKRDVVRFFNFWQPERTLIAGAGAGFFGYLPRPTILAAAVMICGSYAMAVFAGLFGMLMTPPEDRRIHLFLFVSILFPCLIHSLIFAHSRYHLPIMPLVLLYATAALLSWRSLWRRRAEWTFKVAAAGCLMLALAWIRELVMVDLGQFTGLLG